MALDKAQAGNAQAAALAAYYQAKEASAAVAAESKYNAKLAENSSLMRQHEEDVAKNTALSAQKATRDAEYDKLLATVSVQNNIIKSQQSANEVLTKEINTDRMEMPRVMKENSDLNLRNDELATKLEQAGRAIDRLKEQLVEANKPASAAQAGNIGGTTTLSVGLASPVPINGKVTAVQTNNGNTYLALSLGERDNIQVGTRFTISRGAKYVGDAIVERVEADQSVAKVREGNPLPVLVNDAISSGQ